MLFARPLPHMLVQTSIPIYTRNSITLERGIILIFQYAGLVTRFHDFLTGCK